MTENKKPTGNLQKQMIFWIGALIVGALLGLLQLAWLDNLMTLLKKTKLATEKSKAPAAKASDKKTTPAAENEEAHNG